MTPSRRQFRTPVSFLPKRSAPGRNGYSLLEVILALAILAGSMAVLGEIVSIALRNSRAAADLTHAQLLCESKLAEISAGITPPKPVWSMPLEVAVGDGETGWLYSIEVIDVDEDGLVAVRVTVRHGLPSNKRPVECSLTRWVLDPEIDASEGETLDEGDE